MCEPLLLLAGDSESIGKSGEAEPRGCSAWKESLSCMERVTPVWRRRMGRIMPGNVQTGNQEQTSVRGPTDCDGHEAGEPCVSSCRQGQVVDDVKEFALLDAVKNPLLPHHLGTIFPVLVVFLGRVSRK